MLWGCFGFDSIDQGRQARRAFEGWPVNLNRQKLAGNSNYALAA